MSRRKNSNVDINNLLANEQVVKLDITNEIESAMMTYAIKTITDRALPDVRDGLKPVQRRILYGSYKNGYLPNKKFVKNARIVGDVMGHLHPHGDCVDGGSEMVLASGEVKKIEDLYKENKDQYVIAMSKEGKAKIVKAHSFRIGQYANKIYNVYLSNGSVIKVTNNHPFLLKDLTWKRADELSEKDELYSGLIYDFDTDTNKSRPVLNLAYGEISRLQQIAVGINNGEIEKGYVTHHIDENPMNNIPQNIQLMTRHEHMMHHGTHLIGLNKGRERMINGDLKEQTKAKNSYLFSQYNKNQGLFKAIRIIKKMQEDNCLLTEENYNEYRKDYYNYPIIDQMIKRNQIRNFEDLINKANETDSYIEFNKEEAYKDVDYIDTALEREKNKEKSDYNGTSGVIYTFGFNILLKMYKNGSELTRENFNDYQYEKKITSELIDKYVGFDRFVNEFKNKFIFIDKIEIENVDNKPMYDFTVDEHENALFVTNKFDNNLSIICLHNSSIYGALAAMSQPWTYRYPLIDFQGNQGSLDGDEPAAMRYTEGKLQDISLTMLDDVDKECVDFKVNYSEETTEPVVLPGLLPNLLINGSSGIATGYTTDIPPHQLGEVIDGVISVIKNPNATLDEIMKHIKGPDFPGGSCLIKNDNIRQLYETGAARLTLKAKYEIEENHESGNDQIVFTELPHNVNKPNLVEKIYELCIADKTKKIARVIDVRDESKGNEVRIVVELHKTAIPNIVLNELFESTRLQQNISFIMRALVDQTPRVLTLKQIIEYYIQHRKDVILKRTKYLLEKAESRLHIQQGFKIITSNIKKAVDIITNSNDDKDAKKKLIEHFKLTEAQVEQVLEMKLRRLTKLNKKDIDSLINKLNDEIKKYKEIILDENILDKNLITELKLIKEKYNDSRKTTLIDEQDIINEAIGDSDPIVLVLTNKNTIKHISLNTLDTMFTNRSLRERTDYFVQGLKCRMNDTIIIILDNGKYCKVPLTELIVSDLNFLSKESKIKALAVYDDEDENNIVVILTKKGIIKKVPINRLKARNYRIADLFDVGDGDEIISIRVCKMDDDNVITIVTKLGIVHRFFERSFKGTAPKGIGLNAIILKDDDEVVDFDITDQKDDALGKVILYTKHEDGSFGMKTLELNDLRPKGRMSQGASCIKFYKKSPGFVCGSNVSSKDFFILDSKSTVHTFNYSTLPKYNRYNKPDPIDFDINITNFFID